jgi:hypothetical protein
MSRIRRFDPWLRGAIVLYLLSAVCLVAIHQHQGAAAGHDCALCTVAHTPATVAAATLHQPASGTTGCLLPLPGDDRWDFEPSSTSRTRAPPLV